MIIKPRIIKASTIRAIKRGKGISRNEVKPEGSDGCACVGGGCVTTVVPGAGGPGGGAVTPVAGGPGGGAGGGSLVISGWACVGGGRG